MANKAIKFKNYEGQHYEVKLRKPRKEVKASGICYPPENMGERLPQNPLIAILEAFYLKPLETRLVKSLGAVK